MKHKFFTLAFLLGSALAHAQFTQTVDLSTGVVNGSTTLSAVTSNDDTWTVKIPGSGSFQNAIVSDGSLSGSGTIFYYTTGSCARWISPFTVTTGANIGSIPTAPGPAGLYEYKSTFTKTTCQVTSALMTFTLAGADNKLEGFSVNGNYHNLLPQDIQFGPLRTFTVAIPAGEFISGTNTISMSVRNDGSYTGMYLCASLALHSDIAPSLTGSSTFCSGSPLTFTGSSSIPATNTYWEITETNSSWVPVTGGYTWNQWASGSPGTFTFPVTPPCGKYYRVKLAVQSECVGWSETATLIYINCPPAANAGPDMSVCSGGCVTIGEIGRFGMGIAYQWTGPSGVVGNSHTASVCPPSQPSGVITYTYTVTNTTTGCSSSDYMNVNYTNNDPTFSMFINTANPSYFTVVTTANNTAAYSDPGFYYSWEIQELNGSSPYYTDGGTDAWWYFPYNALRGFVSTGTGTYTQTPWSMMPTPPATDLDPGQFLYGHTYKIKRTTWNANCPAQSFYMIITPVRSMATGVTTMEVTEQGSEAVDIDNLAVTSVIEQSTENLSVYPNPGTGLFTLESGASVKANIEVYDALGKKVKALEQNGFKSVIDLTGFPKGIYMINVISEGKLTSKKIVLQ